MMERRPNVQRQRAIEAIDAGRRLRLRAGGWAAGVLVALRHRQPRRVAARLAQGAGAVSGRQFEAGERLRGDWTVKRLAPRVTIRWDAPPRADHARGAPDVLGPTLAQIAAERRMEAGLEVAGKGLGDMLWRIVCAGEGMGRPSARWAGRRAPRGWF